MANNALKLLAQKAKKRLTSAGKTVNLSAEKNTAYISASNYAVVVNTQDLKEDPLYEKIKKLLERDDVLNPIAELTDKRLFESLTEIEKERYVIDISKRNNTIKEHLLGNNA